MCEDGFNSPVEIDPENAQPDGACDQSETGALDRPIETIISFVASPEPQRFDYSTLDDPALAADALATAARIRTRLHPSVCEIGRDLIDMKRRMGHGKFGLWIASELGINRRTAENYMNAANFAEGKSESISLLPPTVLYALGARSALPEVVEEVLAAVDAGTPIPVGEIRQKLNASADTRRKAVKSAEPPEKARDNAKHELAAEAMLPQKNQEEEHEATETKRNDKALSVARFLVSALSENGVAELLSLLAETDWHRVEGYLDGPNWVNGQPIWDEIEIPPLWSDAHRLGRALPPLSEHRDN
jgi:hypothetical protein